MSLTYERASAVVRGIHRHAQSLYIQVSAVVVNQGGFVVAVGRMDGAPSLSSQVGEAKAVGAAVWHPTSDPLVDLQKERPAFFEAEARFARLPVSPSLGSLLLREGEAVVGGVGVGGGTPKQDVECAQAGLQFARASAGSVHGAASIDSGQRRD